MTREGFAIVRDLAVSAIASTGGFVVSTLPIELSGFRAWFVMFCAFLGGVSIWHRIVDWQRAKRERGSRRLRW